MRPTTQRADRPSIWSASAKSEDVQILVGVWPGAWLLRTRQLTYALHRFMNTWPTLENEVLTPCSQVSIHTFFFTTLQWWTNYSHCLNGPWCKRLWAVMNVQLHWKFWFNEVCSAKLDHVWTITNIIPSLILQSLCPSIFEESLLTPYWLAF